MSKYKILQELKLWQIHENKTNQIIFATRDETSARDLKDKLENGTGFNGDTPKFFSQKNPPREYEEYQ